MLVAGHTFPWWGKKCFWSPVLQSFGCYFTVIIGLGDPFCRRKVAANLLEQLFLVIIHKKSAMLTSSPALLWFWLQVTHSPVEVRRMFDGLRRAQPFGGSFTIILGFGELSTLCGSRNTCNRGCYQYFLTTLTSATTAIYQMSLLEFISWILHFQNRSNKLASEINLAMINPVCGSFKWVYVF